VSVHEDSNDDGVKIVNFATSKHLVLRSTKFPHRNIHKCTWTSADRKNHILFKFALDYAIRKVQVNQNGLKLNGTHQRLLCADNVNTLGESVHTVKKKHML
jgi:hypothetical protein